VGSILAEGARRAARSFGPAAEELTVHVKGLELFSADPRGIKGYALMNAVNSRGGDHYRGEPMSS
jgi:aldehyde:ferredoxin oxidoreductase